PFPTIPRRLYSRQAAHPAGDARPRRPTLAGTTGTEQEAAVLSIVSLVCPALLAAAPQVESRFEQVAPFQPGGRMARSAGQERAVVLIHGFLFHLTAANVPHPRFRDWQRPGSLLVKRLAKDSDVFSFSYGQNVPIDAIVRSSSLRDDVAALRRLG